jgi:hypothetical protein
MVDSSRLKPAGFSAGDTTGAIGILPGSHNFTVASVEAGQVTAAVPFVANTSTTLIAYCVTVQDPQTKRPKKAIQLLSRSNPLPNTGKHFQVLFVSSRASVDIAENGVPTRANALKELNVPDSPGGEIKISQGDKPIVQFRAPEAGNFLVVLYEAAAGSLAGLVIPDYK